MILCQLNGNWYLAKRGDHGLDRCTLFVARTMPGSEGFVDVGNQDLAKEVSISSDMRFFPKATIRTLAVCMTNWKRGTIDPIVKCEIPIPSFETFGKSKAWIEEEGRRMCREFEALRTQLVSRGWIFDGREGGSGFLHVDDLDKVEGPPPEAF